jgi:hypothetical protein
VRSSGRFASGPGWRLIDVPKIEDLAVLESTFPGTRRRFHRHHHAWNKLLARVS